MPPSKMAFRPGTEVTLDNALKIIMVKSANDVAATIAEGIGGSVEGFAEMMNAAAAAPRHAREPLRQPARPARRPPADLGPRHGDPRPRAAPRVPGAPRAVPASARSSSDAAIMANHNGLIGRYPGADGMKTGFICASGFNVVASATRDGRRLITVVMGSPSANERTLKAADLFDRGFATSSLLRLRRALARGAAALGHAQPRRTCAR